MPVQNPPGSPTADQLEALINLQESPPLTNPTIVAYCPARRPYQPLCLLLTHHEAPTNPPKSPSGPLKDGSKPPGSPTEPLEDPSDQAQSPSYPLEALNNPAQSPIDQLENCTNIPESPRLLLTH